MIDKMLYLLNIHNTLRLFRRLPRVVHNESEIMYLDNLVEGDVIIRIQFEKYDYNARNEQMNGYGIYYVTKVDLDTEGDNYPTRDRSNMKRFKTATEGLWAVLMPPLNMEMYPTSQDSEGQTVLAGGLNLVSSQYIKELQAKMLTDANILSDPNEGGLYKVHNANITKLISQNAAEAVEKARTSVSTYNIFDGIDLSRANPLAPSGAAYISDTYTFLHLLSSFFLNWSSVGFGNQGFDPETKGIYIQTQGTKYVGRMYIDNQNRKICYCKVTNTDISVLTTPSNWEEIRIASVQPDNICVLNEDGTKGNYQNFYYKTAIIPLVWHETESVKTIPCVQGVLKPANGTNKMVYFKTVKAYLTKVPSSGDPTNHGPIPTFICEVDTNGDNIVVTPILSDGTVFTATHDMYVNVEVLYYFSDEPYSRY